MMTRPSRVLPPLLVARPLPCHACRIKLPPARRLLSDRTTGEEAPLAWDELSASVGTASTVVAQQVKNTRPSSTLMRHPSGGSGPDVILEVPERLIPLGEVS